MSMFSTRPMAALRASVLISFAAMTLAAVQPAEAASKSKGLSSKQVKQIRSIVRQELAKRPGALAGPAGPAGQVGPAGPPGPPGDSSGGFDVRFAHIFPDGTVDTENSRGISQENVVFSGLETHPDDPSPFRSYCIVGLPAPLGGQVSGDDGEFRNIVEHDEQLGLTSDGACVIIPGASGGLEEHGLHLLLIY